MVLELNEWGRHILDFHVCNSPPLVIIIIITLWLHFNSRKLARSAAVLGDCLFLAFINSVLLLC
jgi:hypothetical protein